MAKSKKWLLPEVNKADVLHMSKEYSIPLLVAEILCARGFKCDSDTKRFIEKTSEVFYNPFLLNDMSKAVEVIKTALENNTKIAVYGDYDVDGITSTFILYDFLCSKNANVIYYIPDRAEEGYGMNNSAIDYLKSEGVKLIITVDVGITAVNEVEYSLKNGIEVIVTDHHTLKDTLPQAAAVINPKITSASYPFDALAGVGVAFKLIYAVSGCDKNIFYKYCDAVAIGTIADMVPLIDENRYIVYEGIKKLKRTDNTGLKALMEVCHITDENINSSSIGFIISPRLNSAGRIDKAQVSVELLLEKDYNKALIKAEQLNECNKLRQKEEQQIFDEALEIIKNNSSEKDNFIVAAKKGWSHGVIGIVSSRITEMFYRPSAVISINPDGTGKASGRSIKGINLFDALNCCSDTLVKFGGHELAAGFTVMPDMIEKFKECINDYCNPLITEEITVPVINIDSIINLKNISMKTINDLESLEPYGISNKAPLFCIKDVLIKSIRYTQNGKHAFLTLSDGVCTQEIPAFSMSDTIKKFNPNDYVSVVGILSVNSFRNTISAQFIMKDIKKSEKNNLLDRNDLGKIFRILRKQIKEHNEANYNQVCESVKKSGIKKSQFETALKIFSELQIVDLKPTDNNNFIYKGTNFNSKTELKNSKTYNKYSK